MSEDELTADMAALIREAPRTWKEILQHFIGQPYRAVYGAFSNLRHQLGRCDDEPWYRYTFSDTDFAVDVAGVPGDNFDPAASGLSVELDCGGIAIRRYGARHVERRRAIHVGNV